MATGSEIHLHQQFNITNQSFLQLKDDIVNLAHAAKKYDSWRIARTRIVETFGDHDDFATVTLKWGHAVKIVSVKLNYLEDDKRLLANYQVGLAFAVTSLVLGAVAILVIISDFNIFWTLVGLTPLIGNWYFMMRAYLHDIRDFQLAIDEFVDTYE